MGARRCTNSALRNAIAIFSIVISGSTNKNNNNNDDDEHAARDSRLSVAAAATATARAAPKTRDSDVSVARAQSQRMSGAVLLLLLLLLFASYLFAGCCRLQTSVAAAFLRALSPSLSALSFALSCYAKNRQNQPIPVQ